MRRLDGIHAEVNENADLSLIADVLDEGAKKNNS